MSKEFVALVVLVVALMIGAEFMWGAIKEIWANVKERREHGKKG